MTRRIGAISDVHGDAAALTVVLRWLDKQGISEIVCAGDIAGFGPRPNECISMLMERRVRAVRGNGDGELLRLSDASAAARASAASPPLQSAPQSPSPLTSLSGSYSPPTLTSLSESRFPSAPTSSSVPSRPFGPGSQRASEIAAIEAWARSQLSEQSISYLAGLPEQLEVCSGVLMVHATPGDLTGIIGPQDSPPILAGVDAFIVGHLHIPFVIQTDRSLWVNVGSAGRPCDGDPRPAVTILTESRDRSRCQWKISQHRVDFDPRQSARDILESGMPFAQNVAAAVLEARWYRSL